jgi:hypothetical protein
MVWNRCLLTGAFVCLIAWLGSGAASFRPLGREASVAELRDGKVLEVTTSDGRKRFCWFEAKCDPLVRKHVLGQIDQQEYQLSTMGTKMPSDPELVFKTGHRMPNEDVPCWQVAATAATGGDLWIALYPIFKPRVLWWIGDPPHPHHVASGGDPYEGGIVRVDLRTMATQRWTSAGGLPPELVCHDAKDGEPLPETIVLGAVVSKIVLEGDHVVFTTRNNSQVRFGPAKKAWTPLRSVEPLPAGRYHVKYQISIPAEYVQDSPRRGDNWHGTATTNEISVEVLKSSEDRDQPQ